MSELQEYTVTIGGIKHTMRLSEAHAKLYGDAATPVAKDAPESKAAAAPANKSR